MFTTGQVHYRTKIPIPTIQRYIKDYADHFSTFARVPDKSRRYTEADIQKLLVIRKHYQANAQEAEIKSALAGVLESQALPVGDFENVLQLVEAARLAQIKAERSAQHAAAYNNGITARLGRYDNQHFEIKKKIDALESRLVRQEKLMVIILDALEADGLIEKDKPQAQVQPPKKKIGLLDRLGKWVDSLPDDEDDIPTP